MPYKILIIDDDREFLEELNELLKAPDYVIRTCDESVRAMELVRSDRPDLILLDIKMPEMTGIQLAALVSLSTETRGVPMMLISGNVNKEEIDDAMKICNIRRYFEKPVDPQELISEVRAVLSEGRTPCSR